MREEHIQFLVCPGCKGSLYLSKVGMRENTIVESGILQCADCSSQYEIVGHIPRFVSSENYAAGFGLEWNIHAKTQYDSYSQSNVSEKRFFEETRWERDLQGEVILEVGSGSGRFTEHAASTRAMVVSLDYSSAVDAN